MLAGIVLCAVLLSAQQRAGEPLPPVCIERPPVPARIAGRVTSRDGSPVANVEVHGLVEENHREYRTSSDQQGRFVLTGFEANSEVHLTFRDGVRHVAVGCSVRPTSRQPSVSLGVVIDRRDAPGGDADLGCRWGDVAGTWVAGDGVQMVPRAPAKPADQSLPTLSLRSTDIAIISMKGDAAVLWLSPGGTKALAAFTEANVGRMTLTTIDGEPAARAVVQATISSGVVQVPEDYLRGKRLCEILSRASRP